MWASPVIYYTSNEKRIYDCYEIHEKTGEIRNNQTNRYISSNDGKNTIRVTLFRDRNKGEKVSVARAILSTFVGEPPTRHHTADHINTNYQDNRLENLRWATKSEQSYNQTRTGDRDYKRIPIIVTIDNIEKEYQSISEACSCCLIYDRLLPVISKCVIWRRYNCHLSQELSFVILNISLRLLI